MGKQYLVHGAHENSKDVAAKMQDGTDVVGIMPILTVEMVPVPGSDGRTITLDIEMPNDAARADAMATYQTGAIVEDLGFRLVTPPPAPAQ